MLQGLRYKTTDSILASSDFSPNAKYFSLGKTVQTFIWTSAKLEKSSDGHANECKTVWQMLQRSGQGWGLPPLMHLCICSALTVGSKRKGQFPGKWKWKWKWNKTKLCWNQYAMPVFAIFHTYIKNKCPSLLFPRQENGYCKKCFLFWISARRHLGFYFLTVAYASLQCVLLPR